ncbi:hypothetical protein L9F63_006394, partial [Diploptera punctata]
MRNIKNKLSFNFVDFHSANKPFYYITKVLGLASYSYNRNCLNYKFNNVFVMLSILWSFLMLCALLGICAHHINHFVLTVYNRETPNFITSDILSKILWYSSPASSMICGLINGKKMAGITRKLSNIDVILLETKRFKTYKRIFCFQFVEIVFCIVCVLIITGYSSWAWGSNFRSAYENYECVTVFLTFLSDIQYMNVIYHLKYRYKELNNKLKHSLTFNLHSRTIGTPRGRIIKKHQEENLKTLRHIHNELNEIVNNVNSCYGFQILVEIASIFVQIVSKSYLSSVMFKYLITLKGNRFKYYSCKVIAIFNYALFSCIKLLGLCVICNLATWRANYSLVVIHKLMMRRDLNPDIFSELYEFSVQIANSKVAFTAFNVFPLNMATFLQVIGVSFTYVIIFHQ